MSDLFRQKTQDFNI